jgi:2-dehydro-3-deoxyphosphogluconate aldolase/(4S)-4-hydroxy-2-oxoglutarate aldolase
MAYLKSMTAPYMHLDLRFIPLGGLTANTMADYLMEPCVAAIGGSWIAPRELIRQQQWAQITAHAQQAAEIVQRLRKGAIS